MQREKTVSSAMCFPGLTLKAAKLPLFKTPSEEELNHDFLWRNVKALPEKGSIGIFNRSYYEDVLIVKVRPEVLEREKLPSEQREKTSGINGMTI